MKFRTSMRGAACTAALTIASTVLLASVLVPHVRAQLPDKFTNLKVLPRSISCDELEATMHGFTAGLGVHCSYCHVRPQGQERGEPDWASDAKPEKQTARVMMEMVRRVSTSDLAKITTNHPDHVVSIAGPVTGGSPVPGRSRTCSWHRTVQEGSIL